jgi:preprotein translocase subunit SecG
MYFLLGLVLVSLAIFLIIIILLQRGKGGGLVGALGGAGGQSAFGTRAGDTFTQITVYAAVIWCLVSIIAVRTLNYHASQRQVGLPAAPPSSPQILPIGGPKPGDPVAPAIGTPGKTPDDKKPMGEPKPGRQEAGRQEAYGYGHNASRRRNAQDARPGPDAARNAGEEPDSARRREARGSQAGRPACTRSGASRPEAGARAR